jgi:hypothetical protein
LDGFARSPFLVSGLAFVGAGLLLLHAVVMNRVTPEVASITPSPEPASSAAPRAAPQARSADPEPPRADRNFVRWYRAPLAGGLLTFPPSFSSADGRYDLVLHLNGNTDLVEESFGHAGVNAVVVILNLGVGSGVYEARFADPPGFELIVDRVQAAMRERGLEDARLDRVALTAWSSGYGGVIKILQSADLFDRIDAIVLLDSIFCGYDADTRRLKPDQIDPIRRYARKAAEGKALLSITHSEIETHAYLNALGTTNVLLDSLSLARSPATVAQPMPALSSMVGVLPKARLVALPPVSEAHRGGFHVRGYAGNGPVTHMLHLVQMSTIALPDLTRRWER